jgi:hypothetical protein
MKQIKTIKPEKASATPEVAEETAVLNCRVRRQPASLANYHYHIEPSQKVYVTYRFPNGRIQVSTVANQYRCSDDYFTVPASFLSQPAEEGAH